MKSLPGDATRKLRWSRAGILVSTFVVVTVVMSVSFFPQPLHLKTGDVCPRDYEAPRTVEYINQKATEQEKEKALKSVGIIYGIDLLSIQQAEDAIGEIFRRIREIQHLNVSKVEKLSRLKRAVATPAASVDFSLEVFSTCLAAQPSTLTQLEITTKQIVQKVMDEGIRENGLVKARQGVRRIVKSLPLSERYSKVIEEIAQAMIQPNLVPNWDETERRQQEKMAKVEPIKTVVRRGQIVIHRGEVVQRSHLMTLQALGLYLPQAKWLSTLGLTLLMGLMLLLVAVYIRQSAKRFYGDPRALLLLSTILVLAVVVSKLLFVYCGYFTSNSGYFTAVPAAAMLVTILLDTPLAFITTVVLSVLQGVTANFDLRFAVVALVTGIVSIFSVGKVSKRSDLAGASLILSATNVASILVFGFIRDEGPKQLWNNAVFGVMNGLGCAIFTIGVLPFLEHIFRITTPMKLLELSNPSEPLLRRLLVEAPGTYHHSILVANLAENAAQAIGANGLAARVGAYYHDVGKLRRPYMFVENQFGGENPHDKISPNLSTLIIKSHVRDGLELAREYHLPSLVTDFIAEHHGANLVTYFYHLALSTGADSVAQDDFRYDGPKPTSRESAIVMFADVVEAATRSIKNPTPSKVDNMVRQIAHRLLADGQFDDCQLSFKDLADSTSTFVRIINGMYHARIEYPETLALPSKSDLPSPLREVKRRRFGIFKYR